MSTIAKSLNFTCTYIFSGLWGEKQQKDLNAKHANFYVYIADCEAVESCSSINLVIFEATDPNSSKSSWNYLVYNNFPVVIDGIEGRLRLGTALSALSVSLRSSLIEVHEVAICVGVSCSIHEQLFKGCVGSVSGRATGSFST